MNLTPGGPLARWTEADFVRALRTGRRPDGTAIRPPMPLAEIAKTLNVSKSAANAANFRAAAKIAAHPAAATDLW